MPKKNTLTAVIDGLKAKCTELDSVIRGMEVFVASKVVKAKHSRKCIRVTRPPLPIIAEAT
jgi:hypothetical protein